MVWDFIKMLGQSRVATVKGRVEGKALGVQAKARSKATKKFNEAIDKPMNAAKERATGKKKEGQDKMGFFGKGKGKDQAEPAAVAYDDEAKTAMVDISALSQERSRDVVGWVVPMSGSQKGQDFRLVDGKNLMGTAADAEVVLTDAYMSSRHATIRHENGRFMLIDLDSTNGTFVNGDRISKHELIDNDTVRLGRTELKFKSLH